MKVDLNRLKFDKRLSQAELGDVLGIAQAQVSLMINGKRDIQQEHIDRLVAKFGKEFVDAYVIPDEVVDVFTTPQARTIEAKIYPAEVVEEIKAEVVEEMIVPIVPHEVALKAETNIKKYIEDNASELEHFDPRSVTAEVDTAERICTNSMYPTFLPGDVIFIQFLQEKSKITDGGIYYFDTSTRPTMIRLVKLLDDGRLLLKAFNPRYGDIYMRKEEITNIGKISGMYRQTFSDMYAEIEEVRRKKDEQVDNLIKQNSEALNIIKDLIKKG